MKKLYIQPDIELLKFKFTQDILSISNPEEIPEDYKDGGNGDWNNPDPFGNDGDFNFDW